MTRRCSLPRHNARSIEREYLGEGCGPRRTVNTRLLVGSSSLAGFLVSGKSGSSGSFGSGGSGIVMGKSYPPAGGRIATF
jgi:hypothetical protein